jgi:hypothetical protein
MTWGSRQIRFMGFALLPRANQKLGNMHQLMITSLALAARSGREADTSSILCVSRKLSHLMLTGTILVLK